MYQYRTPGVRFEWLDPPPLVVGRRTDIAGFVGVAARGPLHQAMPVESWTQFTSTFGAHIPQGYLAYAVEGFFANGGRTCWVVRSADQATAAQASLDLFDDRGSPVLRLKARTPGSWGEDVVVTVARTAPDRFSLTLQTSDGGIELWRNLTMAVGDDRYVERLLGDDRAGSRLIEAVDLSAPERFPENTPSERGTTLRGGVGRLTGGADGLATLRPEHLSGDGAPLDKVWGLAALALVDDVSIVAIPDLMAKPRLEVRRKPRPPRCNVAQEQPTPPVNEPPAQFPPSFDDLQLLMLQTALVRHCEQLQDRVAVLDPRIGDQTPTDVLGWRRSFQSSYAALCWPWLLHPDPLGLDGPLRPVPPSGHVAGIYARGDQRVGVHKPPANELVEGIGDVTALADDIAHGELNQAGVNVIRSWNGRGIRVAGARTLSNELLFRYVNVRRLLNMIEKAILEDTQWAVFEPSGPDLWREVDRVVRGFLDRLWRQGILDGATAADAYFVTCDETTTTPQDVDAGRLVTQVGVQPPWPAEFVVVRIGRTEAATEISETGGTGGG